MDYIIKTLPENFQYLNQFAPSPYAPTPSLFRCVAASAAMLAEIAYPTRWIPAQLEDEIYRQLAGPDVATNQNGISKQAILAWFDSVHIGYADNDRYLGNPEMLLQVMQNQNRQGMPQLITVANENLLFYGPTGVKLHNWTEPINQAAHSFVRVGYSDSNGCGLYYEPAAPGFQQPVPIPWEASILKAGIITSVAIMPPGVPKPPADFDWLHGSWPPPEPKPDIKGALATIDTIQTATMQFDKAQQAYEAALAAYRQAVPGRFEALIAQLMGK
jgi:hypothetical protein